MTRQEYLENYGWDTNKYQVMLKDECAHLKDIKGNVNKMYRVTDPRGKKAFGEGTMIVDKFWAAEHTTEAPATNTEAAIPPPPPAKKEASDIPPPPPAKVPEKLQEIADASPNVNIVTPGSTEEKKEAKPEPKEWPGFVKTRIGNLTATSKWSYAGNEKLVSDEGKELTYQDIEDMENQDWTDLLKSANGTKEEKPEVSSDLKSRVRMLIGRGLELDPIDQTLTDQDGKVLSFEDIKALSNEEWMKTTTYYLPKNVRDRKEAREKEESSRAEQRDFEENEGVEPSGKTVEEAVEDAEKEELKKKVLEESIDNFNEAVKPDDKSKKAIDDGPRAATEETSKKDEPKKEEPSLAEQTKFRRQALKAIGWKEDPDPKTEGMRTLDSKFISYQRILDMPEAEFKEWLNMKSVKEEPKKDPVPPKNALKEVNEAKRKISEMSTEELEAYSDEENKVPEKTVEELAKTQPHRTERFSSPDFSHKPNQAGRNREDIAFEIILKMVSAGTGKKKPETIASEAFELADLIIAQRSK